MRIWRWRRRRQRRRRPRLLGVLASSADAADVRRVGVDPLVHDAEACGRGEREESARVCGQRRVARAILINEPRSVDVDLKGVVAGDGGRRRRCQWWRRRWWWQWWRQQWWRRKRRWRAWRRCWWRRRRRRGVHNARAVVKIRVRVVIGSHQRHAPRNDVFAAAGALDVCIGRIILGCLIEAAFDGIGTRVHDGGERIVVERSGSRAAKHVVRARAVVCVGVGDEVARGRLHASRLHIDAAAEDGCARVEVERVRLNRAAVDWIAAIGGAALLLGLRLIVERAW